MTNCPTCNTPSSHVIETFERTFPGPPVRIRRYRCINARCMMPRIRLESRTRTIWDVTDHTTAVTNTAESTI